jgi:hypothetical protein
VKKRVVLVMKAITNEDEQTLNFEYDFNTSEAHFLEKMKSEISMNMNKNFSTSQLQEMLQQSQPKSVYNFSCISDWIAENLANIIGNFNNICNSNITRYEVDSFTIFEKKREIVLTSKSKDLEEVFPAFIKDLNSRALGV